MPIFIDMLKVDPSDSRSGASGLGAFTAPDPSMT